MEANSVSNFIAVLVGALSVGFICGLVPALAGEVTKQKRLAYIGFISCLLGSLVAGVMLSLPIAVGFGIFILIKWFRRPEPSTAKLPREG